MANKTTAKSKKRKQDVELLNNKKNIDKKYSTKIHDNGNGNKRRRKNSNSSNNYTVLYENNNRKKKNSNSNSDDFIPLNGNNKNHKKEAKIDYRKKRKEQKARRERQKQKKLQKQAQKIKDKSDDFKFSYNTDFDLFDEDDDYIIREESINNKNKNKNKKKQKGSSKERKRKNSNNSNNSYYNDYEDYDNYEDEYEYEYDNSKPAWAPFKRYTGTFEDRLHEEILDFVKYITPNTSEVNTRLYTIDKLRSELRRRFPDSKVECFGSFSTGLFLPTSDLDVVVYRPGGDINSASYAANPTQGNQSKNLNKIARHIRSNGFYIHKVIRHSRIPIIKAEDDLTHYLIDISYNQESGVPAIKYIKQNIKEYPALKPLVYILKHFLYINEMNEVFTGGLGSFSVVCLVLSYLKFYPQIFYESKDKVCEVPDNLGTLLINFLYLFGGGFDYENIGISVENGSFYRKKDKGFYNFKQRNLLSLEDPIMAGNDLTRGSHRILEISYAWKRALEILKKGEEKDINKVKTNQPSLLAKILYIDSDEIKRRKQIREYIYPKVIKKTGDKYTSTPVSSDIESENENENENENKNKKYVNGNSQNDIIKRKLEEEEEEEEKEKLNNIISSSEEFSDIDSPIDVYYSDDNNNNRKRKYNDSDDEYIEDSDDDDDDNDDDDDLYDEDDNDDDNDEDLNDDDSDSDGNYKGRRTNKNNNEKNEDFISINDDDDEDESDSLPKGHIPPLNDDDEIYIYNNNNNNEDENDNENDNENENDDDNESEDEEFDEYIAKQEDDEMDSEEFDSDLYNKLGDNFLDEDNIDIDDLLYL
ncbi:hypothetical protein BCR32DRAFT_295884 [Anaeromyces robustus]|uniref:polynucleotide adenylyltransferase n=1 Tax=Anaeromyces robustus TaxID=1754192 RepID=A0A1Y1WTY8_9FUNG|nr:hypothetical protein BCR32DRAFT_295884 [Anaeromyces robustus]|eukprot:ORX77001.1 hypothetical protein BCR32DRAFT_295884 [Anaeromyces robustus]